MAKEIKISDKGGKIKGELVKKVVIEKIPIPEVDPKQVESTPKVPMSKKKKILIAVLSSLAGILLIGIALFYYFGIYKATPYIKPSEIINLTSEYLLSIPIESKLKIIPIPNPSEPKTEESPINGLLFTKTDISKLESRRPVAVMINNHSEARPQSGLNSADLVFEALAEGGITRYLAIFWSEAPEKVGPIRSARQYYLEWLSPFDPLYIYDGCADTTNPKTDACGNVYAYNIKRIATIGAWRWNDGRRYAPHNEYSSLKTTWEYAEDKNWDQMPEIQTWKFKKDATLDSRGLKTKVKITFHERLNNSGAYDTVWTYDNKKNLYFKETGGKIHIDQETNTQVYTKNLIIQEVTLTPSYDEKGRIILTTIGNGKATLFIDGKITTGIWKKLSRTDRTKYYDSQGNEVIFNRGRTWISIVPRSIGKFDIIEQ